MKSVEKLPENFGEIYAVNLQKNKKMLIGINISAGIIALLLAIPAHFIVPITSLFSMENGIADYSVRFLSLIVLIFIYLILHELVHGMAMKICGTKKIEYGFTGIYAFAGSRDFYDKKSYIFIALAPVVILGIVIAGINAFVPDEWFWVVYLIQISNLSGAVGDYFVVLKFSKMPRDILIQDSGVSMKVFSLQK